MELASALNHFNTYESFSSSVQHQNQIPVNPDSHFHRASVFLHAQSGVAGAFVIFVFIAVFILLPLVLWILALYLSVKCNIGNSGAQVLSVIIAFFFPIFYLLFYLIYYTALGNKCN